MARQTWLERNFTLVVISVVVMVGVTAPLVWQFWLVPTVFTENAEAGQGIAEDSIDEEKALQDYREFRTLWFEIKAQHEQTQNYKEQREQFYDTYGEDPDEWSRSTKERHSRINDRIIGSQNQEEMLISEYNAMQADATSAIYQCGLPNRVDKKLFISDGAGVSYTSEEARDRTPPENPEDCKFSGDPEEARE
jgi:hypothetical protein